MATIATPADWIKEAKKNARWLIVLGIVEVIVGILAITSPLIAGMAVTRFVAIMLLIAGGTRLIGALRAASWGAGILGILVGILAFICGALMLARPVFGMASIMIFLAIYLVATGIAAIGLSFKINPARGWTWTLANGILSLVLGFLIWLQWPLSGAWALGTLVGVGIHILFSGWSMIALGTAARSAPEISA